MVIRESDGYGYGFFPEETCEVVPTQRSQILMMKLITLCRSPSKPCSSSDESDSESSEEEEVAEGKRQRVKVDYVAMNSQMFGEEVEEDSDQDYG